MPGIELDPPGSTASLGLCVPVCSNQGLEGCSLGMLLAPKVQDPSPRSVPLRTVTAVPSTHTARESGRDSC